MTLMTCTPFCQMSQPLNPPYTAQNQQKICVKLLLPWTDSFCVVICKRPAHRPDSCPSDTRVIVVMNSGEPKRIWHVTVEAERRAEFHLNDDKWQRGGTPPLDASCPQRTQHWKTWRVWPVVTSSRLPRDCCTGASTLLTYQKDSKGKVSKEVARVIPFDTNRNLGFDNDTLD